MIDFDISSPVELQPDDQLTTVDDIRVGDVVCFVNVAPHQFELVTVQADDIRLRHEPLYRVERGLEPGSISLISVGQPQTNQSGSYMMSPTTQDQVVNHLEFLGYEVEKQDYGISAKHVTLPHLTARFFNEGIVLSTYYITTEVAKANRQRVLDFVNSLNQRTLAIKYFLDDDFDLTLVAFFPNDYEKVMFGRFLQLWKNDYDLVRTSPEINEFLK